MMQNSTSSPSPASMSSTVSGKNTIQSSTTKTINNATKKVDDVRTVGAVTTANTSKSTSTATTSATSTKEWMKRRTIKRIQNEQKKDSARRASLAAADIVWKSCIERLSEQQIQGDGNNVTTSVRSTVHSPKNVKTVASQHFVQRTTSFPSGPANSTRNDFTTIKKNLLNNTSVHSNTSIDYSATRALGFPTGVAPSSRNNRQQQQSSVPITIDYWSEDEEEEKMEDFASEKYIVDKTNINNDYSKRSTVPLHHTITNAKYSTGRSYIEDAAQRGWIRGESECNESLEENDHEINGMFSSLTSTNALSRSNKNNNNNNTIYTTTGIPLDNDEFDLRNQTDIDHDNRMTKPATERKWKLFPFFQSSHRKTIQKQHWYSSRNSIASVRSSMNSKGNDAITRTRLDGKTQKILTKNGKTMNDGGTTTNEAWMCGVCGMAFSAKRTAAIHERQHIEEIVYELCHSTFELCSKGSNKNSLAATVLANNLYTGANRRRNNTSSSSINSEHHNNDVKTSKQLNGRRAGRRPLKTNSKSEVTRNDVEASVPLQMQNVRHTDVTTRNDHVNKFIGKDLFKDDVNENQKKGNRVAKGGHLSNIATGLNGNVAATAAQQDAYRIDDKLLEAIDVDATPLRSGSSIRTEDTYYNLYGNNKSVAASPIIQDPKFKHVQTPEQMPLPAAIRNNNNADTELIGNGSRHVAFSDDLEKLSTCNDFKQRHTQHEEARHRSNSHSTVSDDAQSGTVDPTCTSGIRQRRGGGRRGIISNTDYDTSVIVNKNHRISTIYENCFPGLEADIPDLPQDALVPRIRPRNNSESYPHDNDKNTGIRYYDDDCNQNNSTDNDLYYRSSADQKDVLLLSSEMRNAVIQADEALVNVVSYAESLILNDTERRAEYELSLLAGDKRYYDEISYRAVARRIDPSSKYRNNNESLLGKIQNKLLDAYQLMKDSDGRSKYSQDEYTRKRKPNPDGVDQLTVVPHNCNTLYVNVMVKNSVNVVQHELKRLAKQRWEATTNIAAGNKQDESGKVATITSKFELVRGFAQLNIVKLAGIALASDFTPRRIAVQLSNDLYRLLTPRLKRRGVAIETEIEYRVGPYFVLAINIRSIDWTRLIRSTYREVTIRNAKWAKAEAENQDSKPEQANNVIAKAKAKFDALLAMTVFEFLTKMFTFLFHTHWAIYLPVCWFFYYSGWGTSIRQFIISSVTDEIFYYVEEKGMDMEIRVCRADKQAAFMLSALREIRADGKELKKQQQETESQEKGQILGPYLGPAIKADREPSVTVPGFEIPENLEYVGLDIDLSVGFRRLRWAMLSEKSKFMTELVYMHEQKYEKIVIGSWDKFGEHIGDPDLDPSVNPADFIGREKENEYLMPKSAFVSANMCYEKIQITAYNDYCFSIKKKSRNPDAPFGNSFIAWTQMTIINNGNDSCRLTCSVEPEFPNGPPMVSRQIRSGMRAGVTEVFVSLGATITKYADEFP